MRVITMFGVPVFCEDLRILTGKAGDVAEVGDLRVDSEHVARMALAVDQIPHQRFAAR